MKPISGRPCGYHRQVTLCALSQEQRLVFDSVDRVDDKGEAWRQDCARCLLREEASDDRHIARWVDLFDTLGEYSRLRPSDRA
jgi:hypothetical protein